MTPLPKAGQPYPPLHYLSARCNITLGHDNFNYRGQHCLPPLRIFPAFHFRQVRDGR
jgi:hypothetical protein